MPDLGQNGTWSLSAIHVCSVIYLFIYLYFSAFTLPLGVSIKVRQESLHFSISKYYSFLDCSNIVSSSTSQLYFSIFSITYPAISVFHHLIACGILHFINFSNINNFSHVISFQLQSFYSCQDPFHSHFKLS